MWKGTFRNDTENVDVGTLTAEWTVVDANGVTTEHFIYSERKDQKTDMTAFISTAQAALATYQSEKADVDAVNDKLTAGLNA